MAEFLNSQCPHCGQLVAYSSESTSQTVSCPACKQSFVPAAAQSPIAPSQPPPPASPLAQRTLPLSPPSKTTPLKESVWPTQPAIIPPAAPPPPTPLPLPHLDRAIQEFAKDPAFAGHVPTREQVARAWSMAAFDLDKSQEPSHAALVAALKKMFKEYQVAKPAPRPLPNRAF